VHAHGDDPGPVPAEQSLGQVGGQPQALVMVHRPRLAESDRPADAGSADRLTPATGADGRLAGVDEPVLWCKDLRRRFKERLAVDGVGFENAVLAQVEALGGEGVAVLYTTHHMEEAERLCDRVGIIDQGRLVAEGTRRELVARD
jgi:ABC-type cobalamin transport system ATPase subunit